MIRRNIFALLTLAVLLAADVPVAHATLPIVERLSPLGVVRGEETTVTFHGQRVSDAHQVLVDLPGIEILEVKPVDNKKVEVKLRASKDLAPGLYPVRLICKSGIANLRLIGVGSMPITQETEPNNDFAEPQKIELNQTIEGVADREDVDHYQVKLKKGQTLNVEIEGIRLAYSLNNQNVLDPYIAILDEGRFEVATSDDSPLLQQDGLCSYTAPQDGTYTVLVRDSSFRGNRVCGYRLHVGTFPRPIAVVPAGGTPGSVLKSQLVDLQHNVTEASVQLPSETTDRWPVVTENENGISPSPNWIRVNELPVVMEQEPNDDYRKAPLHEVPAAFCGLIGQDNDYDCFSFTGKKGKKYRVEVFARDVLRSPLDGYCNVFGPDNKTISSSDDSRGKIDPFIEFTAKADGKHTIRLYDQLRGGSPAHNYRIEVTMPEPGFGLTLKELRRYESQVVSVPAGGDIAMMVTAARSGYNGEIRLDLDGLPEGVTATPFAIPPGRAEIPVLLTATADAKHGGSLFSVNGRGDDKNFNVMGKLSQNHNLVLGQNRRHMWSYKTDRAAMAVTDKAPFTIELVQPKTPIVRSGSKNLQVKIVREEGFDGTVSLRTLYNPPGIGVNNSRRIDKGKTETSVPITANGGAAIGQWPLILTASYSTANGTAYLATKPIMLDIQNSLFKYEFPKAAAELGTETAVSVKLEVLREYEGDAEVELVGMPKGITSPAAIQKINKDSKVVTFPLVIAKDTKVAKHKTLICQTRVKVGDETIIQTTGTGEIRVDKPLPPRKDAPKVAKKPAAKKPAAPKVLSRLEQLRLDKGK
ncbi:MAG: serine protease [Pirellulaceae bacterium]|nr:serine protease [Pirellulaceae bacterium]